MSPESLPFQSQADSLSIKSQTWLDILSKESLAMPDSLSKESQEWLDSV